MADFVCDRAGENQFGRDGIFGSDDGIMSEGRVLQKNGSAFCVGRNIDCDAFGARRGAMPRAFHGHNEVPARLAIVNRKLVIFACDFPEAAFDPLQRKISIFCADPRSLNDPHATMLTD